MKYLTLGIPTYNRKEALFSNVEAMVESKVNRLVDVLIIDDNSPDNTYNHLRNLCSIDGIRLLKNVKNLGFEGNFLRLFEECRTEYLIIMSDEDQLISENLVHLEQLLHNYKPLFVSPQFYWPSAGKINLLRGRYEREVIKSADFWNSSFQNSGLVYSTKESRDAINKVLSHLKMPGQVYPQVILSAELIAEGSCYWWDKPLTKSVYQIESEIKDPLYGQYYYLNSRWHQNKMFIDYINERINETSGSVSYSFAEMLEIQYDRLFPSLRSAIELERPEILKNFDRSVQKYYSSSNLYHKVYSFALLLIRNPVKAGILMMRKMF